jgi:uncharacterized protein YidB (DUF937 family)
MPQRNFRPIRNEIASRAKSPDVLSFPSAEPTHGTLLMFREYTYQPTAARGFAGLGSQNITDSIFLPLPGNIADSLEIRVQRFDQGGAGEIASTVLSDIDVNNISPANLTTALMSGAVKALPANSINQISSGGSFNEIMKSVSADLAFALRKGIDATLPNQGRNIDAGTGTFINPKAALSFEGLELKTHNFDWILSPKSDDESKNLRRIIETIKRNILPSYAETGVLQKALFKYPSVVDCFFVGLDPQFYFYFKTCMVRSFNVNYSPSSVAVLKGGRPAAVQLTMSLLETDIHTAEDYGG